MTKAKEIAPGYTSFSGHKMEKPLSEEKVKDLLSPIPPAIADEIEKLHREATEVAKLNPLQRALRILTSH